MISRRAFVALLPCMPALLPCMPAQAAQATGPAPGAALWPALRAGGLILALRHAETEPGIGDPPQFRLGDCATQRNLSAAGRAQAQRLGQQLLQQGVGVNAVFSSRWCRCIDTARLAFGRVQPLPALDSFFGAMHLAQARTMALRQFLTDQPLPKAGNLVVVTHQVNITALTGIHPAMGESVVLERGSEGRLDVLGTLPPP